MVGLKLLFVPLLYFSAFVVFEFVILATLDSDLPYLLAYFGGCYLDGNAG